MIETLIWDFDGTLAESYEAIMAALEVLYGEEGWTFDGPAIAHEILDTSVGQLLEGLALSQGRDARLLKARFMAEQEKRDDQIVLMPFAKEVLAQTAEQGIRHFIYTHKGPTTAAVLDRLGIGQYFTEVVDSSEGFARKPDPEALMYLMTKYGLAPERTAYVGDRSLDKLAAERAGLLSISLTQPSSPGNLKIDQLSDILSLPIF